MQMSQNAVARPDMRLDEFPVYHSGETSLNESPNVVIFPPRRGCWTIGPPFLRPLGQGVAKRFLPGVLAMLDSKATHDRHARIGLQPLLEALQHQVLVEPMESLTDGDQVRGTRYDREILGLGMDPLDIGDVLAVS